MAKPENIIISTGGIDNSHKIISIIFAAGIQKFGGKGMFKKGLQYITDDEYNGLIEQVYASAITLFKEKASKVGADAIIHTKFDIEQITLTESGVISAGDALRIQVFCTGTAVKFV